jgi:hypothetical protein
MYNCHKTGNIQICSIIVGIDRGPGNDYTVLKSQNTSVKMVKTMHTMYLSMFRTHENKEHTKLIFHKPFNFYAL